MNLPRERLEVTWMTKMSEHHDIYVRAHTVRVDAKPSSNKNQTSEPKWSDYALVFDCESRITADQTLTFGFWRFCEIRNGEYVALEEGIFHDNGLSAKEIRILRKFARSRKADTSEDGCNRIRLYPRYKFIREVVGIAIQAKAFVVCFNCGFDLSRIAVDWETAYNGGWSLILSEWANPDTG
jgi:hypothetical protein